MRSSDSVPEKGPVHHPGADHKTYPFILGTLEFSQCTRNITHLYFVPLKRRLYFVFDVLFDVLYLISKGYFYDVNASLTSDNNRN